jgi:hypothetical protein
MGVSSSILFLALNIRHRRFDILREEKTQVRASIECHPCRCGHDHGQGMSVNALADEKIGSYFLFQYDQSSTIILVDAKSALIGKRFTMHM